MLCCFQTLLSRVQDLNMLSSHFSNSREANGSSPINTEYQDKKMIEEISFWIGVVSRCVLSELSWRFICNFSSNLCTDFAASYGQLYVKYALRALI